MPLGERKPLRAADYLPAVFSDADWAQLQKTYPDGVCDYAKPGVDVTPTVPWLTYEGGPGGRHLGDPPASVTLDQAGKAALTATGAAQEQGASTAAPASGSDPSAQVLAERQTRTGPSTRPTTGLAVVGLAVVGLAWTGLALVVIGARLRRFRKPGLQ